VESATDAVRFRDELPILNFSFLHLSELWCYIMHCTCFLGNSCSGSGFESFQILWSIEVERAVGEVRFVGPLPHVRIGRNEGVEPGLATKFQQYSPAKYPATTSLQRKQSQMGWEHTKLRDHRGANGDPGKGETQREPRGRILIRYVPGTLSRETDVIISRLGSRMAWR
jgi:hypothetical protein